MKKQDKMLPVLDSKLHRPAVTRDHLHREGLLARLEVSRDLPLSLVSAPAGYGKSTLVSCWLDSCVLPGAWLSLDAGDDDRRPFLSGVLAAVRSVFPGACRNTQSFLDTADLPPLPVTAHGLIDDLERIGERFVLVLDDYHVIGRQEVHDLLAELLRHPLASLHLVLTTRADPPLPLARLRARGQLGEIRAHDLRFSREETGKFLERSLGKALDDNSIAALEQKTEGWVTGLRLSVHFLEQRSNLENILQDMPAESRYVMDYLLAEVLAGQPERIQKHLLSTAILDRFCAPLCDAVCGPDSDSREPQLDGRKFLGWLEKSNLFMIPLDGQGRWVRYHHLFQSLLQRQLKRSSAAEEVTALYRRASDWCAGNGLIDEALNYALASGDVSSAADLVQRQRHGPLNGDRVYVLEKWLSRLPEDEVRQRPELLLARIWGLHHHFSLWAIPPLLQAVEALLGEVPRDDLAGEVDLFNGILRFWNGEGQRSLELFDRALERIAEEHVGARNEAEIYLAVASQIAGRGSGAVRTFRELFHGEQTEGTRKIRRLGSVVFVQLMSGELFEAEEASRQLLEMGVSGGNRHAEAWASYLLGLVHYHWNDLEAAVRQFSRALENGFALDAGSDIDSFAGLILSCQALGQPEKADDAVKRMMEYARNAVNPAGLPLARSVRARLRLLQGDLEPAVRWLETIDESDESGTVLFWLEVPRYTRCRVLLAQGTAAALGEARKRLGEHERFARSIHNTPQLIEVLCLRSAVRRRLGETVQALLDLEQALALARPGGYLRPFLDAGDEMAELLKRFEPDGEAAEQVGRILAAFREQEPGNGRDVPGPSRNGHPLARNQALETPLSIRELQVLTLLGQGMRNKEIALELSLSPETVKRHAANIYRKLDVHNRQNAVVKADSLGLLKP